jgi:ankyrin repeat protein
MTDAIIRGDVCQIRELLERRNFRFENFLLAYEFAAPAIVVAACEQQHEIVRLLLDAGAAVDQVDEFNRTACHHAARDGNIALLELLRAHGADFNATDTDGATPLILALHDCNNMKMRCVNQLIAFGARLDELGVLLACVVAGRRYIQLLIDAGINVGKLRDPDHGTSLHWVIGYVREEPSVAKLDMLLNVCGADVNAADDFGCTPCHTAAKRGSRRAIRWLIENGADFDSADMLGKTPLHETVGASYFSFKSKCMCLLLAAGANVHAVFRDGETALHCVARFEDQDEPDEAVHLLLAAGADLDAVNGRGVTPRQLLSQRDYIVDPVKLEVARRLIAKTRLDLVRERALQVCIGLQSLQLDALQMCEILSRACGPMAALIEFHQWWAIATSAKHFKSARCK